MSALSENPPVTIDLAAEPDFAIGALRLYPSRCRAASDAGDEKVEPRVMEVLICLWRAHGQTVPRDDLIAACWSNRAVTDDAVGRAIAKLRRLGATGGRTHFLIETVPKVGFRLVEGERQETDVAPGAAQPPGQPVSQPASQPQIRFSGQNRLLAAGVAIAAVALIIVAIFSLGHRPAARHPADDKVLLAAFAPADASDARSAQSARKATEAALRRMTGFVIAETKASAAAIGEDAAYRLSGVVSVEQDELVFSTRLVEQTSNLVLWTEKFAEPLSRSAGAEERVAIALAGTLHCARHHAGLNRDPIPSDAFSLMLRTCGGLIIPYRDELEPARQLNEKFPEIFGAGSLFSLSAAASAIDVEHSPKHRDRLIEEARAAAEAALKRNPNDSTALIALSFIARNRVEKARHLDNALAADPDFPIVIGAYVAFLREVGRLKEAKEIGVRTLFMSDPRVSLAMPHVAFLSAMLGDDEAVELAIRKYDEIYPGRGAGLRWTVAAWWLPPETALPLLSRLAEEPPETSNLDCFTIVLGALAEAAPLEALPEDCSGLDPHWRTRLLARLGHIDAAYVTFNAMDRARALPQILFYPEMKEFRRDPRFLTLIAEFGLIDYWRSSDNWPDFCEEPDLPFDCRAL